MEKYNIQFSDTFGNDWYCGISTDDYSGQSKNIAASDEPLTISYDTSGGVRGRIKGSFAEIEILYDHKSSPFEWNEFIRTTAYSYSIIIVKNNSVYWRGVLEPDLPTIPFKSGSFTLKLRFSDGFARLKNFNLSLQNLQSPFTNDTYREKCVSVIKRCLDNVGIGYQTIKMAFNIVEYSQYNYNGRTGGMSYYYQSPESYASRTCYDVIFDLMTTFDAFICQRNGDLWLIRYPELSEELVIWEYNYTTGIESQIGILNPIKEQTANEGGSKDQMFRFLKDGGQMNFVPSINGFNVAFDYGVRDLLNNSKFDFYDGEMNPIGWDTFKFVGQIFQRPDGSIIYNNGLIYVVKDVVFGNTLYNKHLQLMSELNKRSRSGIQDYNEKWIGETGITSKGTNACRLNSVHEDSLWTYSDLFSNNKLSWISQTISDVEESSSLKIYIKWIGESIIQYIDGGDDYKKKTRYGGATFYLLITLKTEDKTYYLNGDTWADYFRINKIDENDFVNYEWHDLTINATPTPKKGKVEIRVYQPIENPSKGSYVTYNTKCDALYIDTFTCSIAANENVIEKKDAFDNYIVVDPFSIQTFDDQNMLIGDAPQGLSNVNYSFRKEYSNFIGGMMPGAISYPCNQWYDYATKYTGQLVDHLIYNLANAYCVSQIVLRGKMFANDIDILSIFVDDNNLYGYNFYFQSLSLSVKKGISTITAASLLNSKYFKVMGTEQGDDFISTEQNDYILVKER